MIGRALLIIVTVVGALWLAGLVRAQETVTFAANSYHFIDADTIRGPSVVRYRIFGIDAPELGQPCLPPYEKYDCGAAARDDATIRFADRTLYCTVVGRDVYTRPLIVCDIGRTGLDLGTALIAHCDAAPTSYRVEGLSEELQKLRAKYLIMANVARQDRTDPAPMCRIGYDMPWRWRREATR